MTLAGLVADAREAAAALMTDACTITRGTGTRTYDETTDTYVVVPGPLLYTGPCRVKPRNNVDRVVEAGAQTVSLFPFVVSVPISSVHFDVDDTIVITASALDPALPGMRLRVRSPLEGSQISARRLGCEVQED